MPIVYLVVAVAGLPFVLLGLRADRAGRSTADTASVMRRAIGAVLLFGGLTGLALSILSIHPVVAGLAALGAGAAAGYLRARIIQLSAVSSPAPLRDAASVEGSLGSVVAEVSDEAAGKIVVEAGGERWYLAAAPIRRGTYGIGTTVVVVALRGEVALVAAPEEVGR